MDEEKQFCREKLSKNSYRKHLLTCDKGADSHNQPEALRCWIVYISGRMCLSAFVHLVRIRPHLKCNKCKTPCSSKRFTNLLLSYRLFTGIWIIYVAPLHLWRYLLLYTFLFCANAAFRVPLKLYECSNLFIVPYEADIKSDLCSYWDPQTKW